MDFWCKFFEAKPQTWGEVGWFCWGFDPKMGQRGASFLAGPTRRECGKFHPQYTNVKVDSLIPY